MEKAEQQWAQEGEEEEVVGLDLRGRPPRNRDTISTAITIAVSNGNRSMNDNRGDIVPSSEPANRIGSLTQDQEFQEEEFQNSNKDSNRAAIIDKGIQLDGQEISEKNVYYDQDKGIWKCRNCCWTYQSGSPLIDLIQNPKWHLHMTMNVKTVDQRGPCFSCETEGAESTHGFSGVKHSSVQCSSSEKNYGDGVDVAVNNFDIQKNLGTVINHQYKESLKDDSLSGFSHLPSEKSFKEQNTNYKSFNNKTIEREDISLLKERYQEITELDVERVLEKQDTHDLYCPNCNSCITRRVILRKRKQKIRIAGEDAKRNKLETVVHSELDAISAHATNDQGRDAVDIRLDDSSTPAANDYSRDREPDIFRCLSCFSFFIPTGNGFKLFQIFGDKSEKENVQNPQQISAVNKNWFFSIFASDKGKMLIEQGSDLGADREKNNVGSLSPSFNLNDQNGQALSVQEAPSPTQSFGVGGLVKSSTTEPPEGGHDIVSSTQGPVLLGKNGQASSVQDAPSFTQSFGVGELVKSSTTEAQEGGDTIVSSSTLGTTWLGKVIVDAGEKLDDSMKNNVGALIPSCSLNDQNGQASSVQEVPPAQSYGVRELVKSSTTEPQGGGDNIVSSSTQGPTLLEEVIVNVGKDLDDATKKGTGGDALDLSEVDTVNQLSSSSFSNKMLPNYEREHLATQLTDRTPVSIGEPAENSTLIHQQDGLKLPVPSSVGSLIPEKSKSDQKPNVAMEKKNAVAVGTYPSEVSQHTITRTKADIHTEDLLKTDRDAFTQSVQGAGALLLQDGRVNIGKDLKDMPAKSNVGNDTIIVVEEGPVEPAASQRAQNIIASAETGASPHIVTQVGVAVKKVTEAREVHGLDIIKSFVYGGLIESITSLGVVSSAAGADAATLNVLALGLANLFGGLLIIGHSLWELKDDHSVGASTEQVDRYQEQLGQRENFLLHATVAVLSFLIFGLAPPIIYGFSFRDSDNRDFKLVAVASASLLCIIILAIGKCFVQRPPKSYIKTVIYYVIMGFMVSGVSYVVGDLIKILLEKLGWFQSRLVVTSPLLEKTPMEPGWKSY